MSDSQAMFWLSMMAVVAWAPMIVLVWAFSKSKSGTSPAADLAKDVRGGMLELIERWPGLAAGKKRFLLAASFSSGAAVIGVARLGSELASWASVTFGGMSVGEASIEAPLGSWWTVWALQACLIAAFFAWVQLKSSTSTEG